MSDKRRDFDDIGNAKMVMAIAEAAISGGKIIAKGVKEGVRGAAEAFAEEAVGQGVRKALE